jgi:hypothetical protein
MTIAFSIAVKKLSSLLTELYSVRHNFTECHAYRQAPYYGAGRQLRKEE